MGYQERNKVVDAFQKAYGTKLGLRCFFAPGRVNLIGDHTDYNGGHVLPCALSLGTYAAVRMRSDNICRFFSLNFEEEGIIETTIDNLKFDENNKFANYPLGVIYALEKNGYNIPSGFDIAFFGDIPYCSGLSSSASVEVLTAYICKVFFKLDLDGVQLAQFCRQAENDFVGVNCGIMDQFIVAMGKENCATFLDTSNLEYEYIPVELGDYKLVIACSNKQRGLKDSKYNERRAQCEHAVADIDRAVSDGHADIDKISLLCELDEAEFEKVSGFIKDPIEQKRARHAVLENMRTIKACNCLRNDDIISFGKLMNESHISLRDDYEVTGIELDALVTAAWNCEGVLGSRMTGAGFGGCTVSIVKSDCVDSFIDGVGSAYLKAVGLSADFYVVETGNGPREI